MKMSEKIDQIATSLAKAQGAIKSAAMDSLNQHFKNRYANLESVTDAIRTALSTNDISYVQNPQFDIERQMIGLNTMLLHKSGQWLEFDPIWCKPPRGLVPQEVGSALTYLRRYSLSASVGVTQGAEEDDDGNMAQASATAAPRPVENPVVSAFANLKITQKNLETALGKALAKWTDADHQKLRSVYNKVKQGASLAEACEMYDNPG